MKELRLVVQLEDEEGNVLLRGEIPLVHINWDYLQELAKMVRTENK